MASVPPDNLDLRFGVFGERGPGFLPPLVWDPPASREKVGGDGRWFDLLGVVVLMGLRDCSECTIMRRAAGVSSM